MKLVNINKVKAYMLQRLYGLLSLVISAMAIVISINWFNEAGAALFIFTPAGLYLLCTKHLVIDSKYYPNDFDRGEF